MKTLSTLFLSAMFCVMANAQDISSLPQPVIEETFIPSWYFNMDFAVVQPRLRSGSFEDTPSFSQKLDWTVAPRFEFGLMNRPGRSWNPYIGYQGIYSEASEVVYEATTDTFFSFAQSAEINAIDFGMLSEPFCFLSVIRAQLDLSVRLTIAEFRQRLAMDFVVNQPSFVVGRLREEFVGAGPRAGLRMELPLADTGLALTGRIDGGVQWGGYEGRVRVESVIDGDFTEDQDCVKKGGVLWHAGAQLALRYNPSRFCDRMSVSVGYGYETWFSKDLNFMDSSHFGRFDYHGPFVRMEWRY